MHELEPRTVECPYCGEKIDVLIDPADAQQQYIEDCQVCCRPINFSVLIEPDGEVQLRAMSDNE